MHVRVRGVHEFWFFKYRYRGTRVPLSMQFVMTGHGIFFLLMKISIEYRTSTAPIMHRILDIENENKLYYS